MCHAFDHGIGKIFAKVAPIAAAFIPGVGPLASAALAAGASKLTGGSWGDALKAGALSGLGSVAGGAFSSAFPETAASIGMGGASGLASGMGDASGAAGAGADSSWTSLLDNAGITDAGSAAGLMGGATAAAPAATGFGAFADGIGSGVKSALSDIPVVGNVLDKGLSWASNNPIPAALAAGSLYSGYQSSKNNEKEQQASQAALAAKNASDLSDWKYTLSSAPINRPANDTSGIDYAHYGATPEFNFFKNNQLLTPEQRAAQGTTPGMAMGGKVTSPFKGNGYNTINSGLDRFASNDIVARATGGPISSADPLSTLGSKAKALQQRGSFKKKVGAVKGPGKGMDDKVRAMLSDGEYVMPADVVGHLGDGSSDAGSKALDQIVAHIRKVKTGNTQQPAAFGAV